MLEYSDNTPKAKNAQNGGKHPYGSIWSVLRTQAKNTEAELLRSDRYGKGAGARDSLANPRGIYAEVLGALNQ